MSNYLTCPVCDRPKIESDICPNCETNLALIRRLTELPPVAASVTPKSRTIAPWLPLTVAIILLLLGMGLGVAGNSFYVQQRVPAIALTTTPPPASPPPQIEETPAAKSPKTCGGFYYKVQRGDSLSRIASRLYGDSNLWPKIVAANPQLKSRENDLNIGELFFVPNLEDNCP
ncbi:MAG: hypothetical protein Fur0025_03220 [Oscillatoriaceae cyanobacterium]